MERLWKHDTLTIIEQRVALHGAGLAFLNSRFVPPRRGRGLRQRGQGSTRRDYLYNRSPGLVPRDRTTGPSRAVVSFSSVCPPPSGTTDSAIQCGRSAGEVLQ